MDEVIVHILHTYYVKENLPFVLSFIDNQRREKAERFFHEKDRLLSLGAGYLLKKYLPAGEIKTSENGKPYLDDGPFFNLSHSGEYVVLVTHGSRDVGVDIEKINHNQADGIRYVLNDTEKKITDLDALFLVWSNKESLIKCVSTGLKDIKSVSGLPLEGIRTINEDKYYSKSWIYDGYSLSVTLKGVTPFKTKINLINTLEER